MLERLSRVKKIEFVFILIGLLLCMDVIAQDSTLDIYVNYEGKPADGAAILIDGKEVGKTSQDGKFNTSTSQGEHTATANWQDNNYLRNGTVTFFALPDSHTDVHIDLVAPRNLGWIWQLVKGR